MASDRGQSSGINPPGFVVPGVRCALEMVLVAGIMLLLGLPAPNPIYRAIVVALTVVAVTVVLFWCLNRQVDAWIAYARRGGQTRSRSRRPPQE
jgi:hypothetical protein